MKKSPLLVLPALVGLFGGTVLSAAPFVDTFGSTAHAKAQQPADLSLSVGGTGLQAVRTAAGWNGFTWSQGNANDAWSAFSDAFSLNPADGQFVFKIDGIAAINPGGGDAPQWGIDIHFFDAGGARIGDSKLQPDTTLLGDVSYDIAAWASSIGGGATYADAVKWAPFIYVITGTPGNGLSFAGMSAIPEPASAAALAGAGAVLMLAVRRRRRA